MRRTILLLALLGAAAPAGAQDTLKNLGIGYQFLRFEELSFPLGLNLDFVGPLTEQLALVGEVGWSRDTAHQFGLRAITTALHVGGGVRWSKGQNHVLRPFGQVLFGLERDKIDIEKFGNDAGSSFLLQPGGGIIIRVKNQQDFFGQVDLRRVVQEGDAMNAVRLSIGLRFNIR